MPGKVRFGHYELDGDAMELRKHGVLIRLQEQPLRVLAILVERPGRVITREELQNQIWGNTFVDFDQSLNKAVNRLREALDDSAGTPEYIETVPRRGYRFIGPTAAIPLTEAQGAAPTNPGSVEGPKQSKIHRPWIVLIAALTIVNVIAVVTNSTITWFKRHHEPTLQELTLVTTSGSAPALSRDGKLLAYASVDGGGQPHIWVQQTAGGPAVQATTGSYSGNEPDFSPDGTRIAFHSDKDGGGIYVTSSLPGEPRLVIGAPVARRPRFSPDGSRILFWKDFKAFTVSLDGGQPIAWPGDSEFRLFSVPIWSPNGKEILFYGTRNGEVNKPSWWIAPVGHGQARLARIPRVQENYFPPMAVIAWIRTTEGRDWVVYSTASLENWKLWRVGISPEGAIDQSPEFLISGNGELGWGGSASEDGKLALNLSTRSASIYQISINDRGQKLGITTEVPLSEGVTHNSPSVSRDGRWMAYSTFSPRKPNIVLLRNLTTGTEHLIDDKNKERGIDQMTSISPDGKNITFERDCKEGIDPGNRYNPLPCGFMVSATGGAPKRICDRCGARGFSSDGSVVLLEKYDQMNPNKDRIVALDLRTSKEKDFLNDPNRPLSDPSFSWDDHWVAFVATPPGNSPNYPSQLLIAPVRHGLVAAESEWIAVSDGEHSDDKPQFSAGGNTLYFTSTRDGYLCIWAQRLDPVTKHPVGPPAGYEHFHNSAGRSALSEQGWLYLSVARDKILFNLPQVHSEVWMSKTQ